METCASAFFYRDQRNMEVLEFLLANRCGNPVSAFSRGLREYVVFFVGAHGWAWGTAEALFIYGFTWPIYVATYSAETRRLAARLQRLRAAPSNIVPVPPVGEPRKPLGFLHVFGPWGWYFLFRRAGEIYADVQRHTGVAVHGPGFCFLPFGCASAARTLVRHFEQESGTLVPDPDRGVFDVATKVEIYPDKEFEWHLYKRQIAERRTFWRGHLLAWSCFRPVHKKLNDLQEVLNRHAAFHEREGAVPDRTAARLPPKM